MKTKMDDVIHEETQMRKMRIVDQDNEPVAHKVPISPSRNKLNDDLNIVGSAFGIPES